MPDTTNEIKLGDSVKIYTPDGKGGMNLAPGYQGWVIAVNSEKHYVSVQFDSVTIKKSSKESILHAMAMNEDWHITHAHPKFFKSAPPRDTFEDAIAAFEDLQKQLQAAQNDEGVHSDLKQLVKRLSPESREKMILLQAWQSYLKLFVTFPLEVKMTDRTGEYKDHPSKGRKFQVSSFGMPTPDEGVTFMISMGGNKIGLAPIYDLSAVDEDSIDFVVLEEYANWKLFDTAIPSPVKKLMAHLREDMGIVEGGEG